MKTGPADIQSNRFCNLSAPWEYKHESLLNLNSSECPMAMIMTAKSSCVAGTCINYKFKKRENGRLLKVQMYHFTFFEHVHFIFYHQLLVAFLLSSKSCLLCSLRVTFCELPSHQFLCQTHFPFMRDFGKGV